MKYQREEYNAEPVHYCKNCLSLNIKEISNATLYVCGECGNVNIEEANINEWTELYTKEYGHSFLSEETAEMEEDI